MTMNTILVNILIFILFFSLSNNLEQDFVNYLGTKTPYRIIANQNVTPLNFEGCKPIKFWGIVRHGTRNPNKKLINQMHNFFTKLRDDLVTKFNHTGHTLYPNLDILKKWTVNIGPDEAKYLTHEGENEMLELAERMQTRFPNIFNGIYSSTAYKFKYTATQRTQQSARSFAIGLFSTDLLKHIKFPEALKKDPILRFYKLCKKWIREINKNPDAYREYIEFENEDYLKKVVENVNERLDVAKQLNSNDIYSMYSICAFETAWRQETPWCAPFTLNDFKVLEYYEDLKYFWKDGYGHALTYKQACPAFNDMIKYFQTNETYPKSILYFTHSGTLLKMLAHMELYKQSYPLVSEDYPLMEQRVWKVSKIDAFGTNLMFVLYDCDDHMWVLTLHQEKIVRLPPCPNTDLCELEKIIEHYDDSINECHFDQMCDN